MNNIGELEKRYASRGGMGMNILEHTLLALGVCLGAVAILFSRHSKLEESEDHPVGYESGRINREENKYMEILNKEVLDE